MFGRGMALPGALPGRLQPQICARGDARSVKHWDSVHMFNRVGIAPRFLDPTGRPGRAPGRAILRIRGGIQCYFELLVC